MRFLSLFICVCACALTACESTRTITSGPQNVSTGNGSSYSPEREARSRAAGEQAALAGQVGQVGQGDAAFQQHFGFNAGGYIQKKQDPKDPTKSIDVYGLNYMSEKNFGGDLNSKDLKSFTQTRDFVSKRYSNTREMYQKESSSQGVKSWFSNKKANADHQARESGADFSGGSRVIANKASSSDGRAVSAKDARENGRVSQTKDYYAAKAVLDKGHDAPKIIGQGDKATNDSIWRLIKSRTRDNPATVEDIRALQGKTN